MTFSALATYPEIERIDCVEIEPGVIHAAPFLESLNRGVLRDPRVRIHLDDGRNFLLTSREQAEQKVEFSVEDGPKGLQAANVVPVS